MFDKLSQIQFPRKRNPVLKYFINFINFFYIFIFFTSFFIYISIVLLFTWQVIQGVLISNVQPMNEEKNLKERITLFSRERKWKILILYFLYLSMHFILFFIFDRRSNLTYLFNSLFNSVYDDECLKLPKTQKSNIKRGVWNKLRMDSSLNVYYTFWYIYTMYYMLYEPFFNLFRNNPTLYCAQFFSINLHLLNSTFWSYETICVLLFHQYIFYNFMKFKRIEVFIIFWSFMD